MAVAADEIEVPGDPALFQPGEELVAFVLKTADVGLGTTSKRSSDAAAAFSKMLSIFRDGGKSASGK